MAKLCDVDIDDLMEFADSFDSLGSSVQRQLFELVRREFDDLNPNAVDLIKQRMSNYHDSIDEAISAYYDWLEEGPEIA